MAISSAALNKKLTNQLYTNIRRRIRPRLEQEALRKVERAKKIMLGEIAAHPVSRDIGTDGPLFGFLGFYEGETPVADLIDFFNERIFVRPGKLNSRTNLANFNVQIPSKTDMLAAGFALEWIQGVPWPELIEIGVPGGLRFMLKEGFGRSDEGVQAKGDISASKYPEVYKADYLSVIIGNFRKNIISA